MKIAIPLAAGLLSPHFGHCEQFAIVEVDAHHNTVRQTYLEPPAHEPGALPRWLSGLGADVILAGGMGRRAQQLFAESGVDVVVGVPVGTVEELVSAYLAKTLVQGQNLCDH